MRFENADPRAALVPEKRLPGTANYLIGSDRSAWRTNVPTYAAVRSSELYPGTDIVFYGQAGQLEYDLVLRPGADPAAVRIRFEGHRKISLDESGDLVVELASKQFKQKLPFAYQMKNGERQRIPVSYRLISHDLVQLEVGRYDQSKILTIDPVLILSTYVGTPGNDTAFGVATDSENNIYVAGGTDSAILPVTPGVIQGKANGLNDGYIMKLNPSASAVLFTTYYGGHYNDFIVGLVIDAQDNIYVAGQTQSNDLPTTPGAFQTKYGGGETASNSNLAGDGFVAKLDKTGTRLIYASFLGGSQSDTLLGLAVDSSGSAIVTGATISTIDFPVTANAFKSTYGGNTDGFITKFNPSGSALVFSSYLGGREQDGPERVAVDAAGNIFIVGTTISPDFPVTPGTYRSAARGSTDSFLMKVSPQGDLLASMLFSTSRFDQGRAVAVDRTGNVYMVGQTSSPDELPITPGAPQATYAGGVTDAFVAKFDSSLSRLLYCTYLGGEGNEDFGAIVIDGQGNAWVSVQTTSTIFGTTPDALQTSSGGGFDAILVEINAAGTAFPYKTFVGGGDADRIVALKLDGAGNLYAAGVTASRNFPVTRGVYKSAYIGGAGDGFVMKFQTAPPELRLSASALNYQVVGGSTQVATQQIQVSDSGERLAFTVQIAPASSWLRVEGGTASPATLTVSVDPRMLTPGRISAVVTLSAAAPTTAKVSFSVTVDVSANLDPEISSEAAVNGATLRAGAVSPGLIVTFYGSRLGPSELRNAELGSDGLLSTSVGGTRVTFDGKAAPIVYTSSTQVSAIVPYGVSGAKSTVVQLEYSGRKSNAITLPVVATSPGIFTVSATGSGAAVAFSEDGTLNTSDAPSAKDSIVVLYATGEGETIPAGTDGKPAADVYPKPRADVTLTIGGQIAEVLYAGAAPNLTAGLMQINARIPRGIPSGNVSVVLSVGGATSRGDVTLAVRD